MKEKHCKREYNNCGLYWISIAFGPKKVPEGMFPNQTGRAEQMIDEYYRKKSQRAGSKRKDPGKESC